VAAQNVKKNIYQHTVFLYLLVIYINVVTDHSYTCSSLKQSKTAFGLLTSFRLSRILSGCETMNAVIVCRIVRRQGFWSR